MRLGFTGTRFGMTAEQIGAFRALILHLRPSEFHHGDCVGADDDAALIVDALKSARGLVCDIISHPADDRRHRAFNTKHNGERPPRPPLQRNQNIVNAAEALVVVPRQKNRRDGSLSGGTWFTHGCAARAGLPCYIIWPCGTVEEEK